MNNFPKQAVVLAAGESSRFWPLNSRHKSLFRVMGKPLIWYTINCLRDSGVKDVIVIQGPKRDAEEELKSMPFCVENVHYVVQPEPLGIGNALLCAKDLLQDQFIVMWAHQIDCLEAAAKMVEKSNQSKAKTVLAGQETKTTWLYGIARLEGDRLFEVVEKPEQGKEPSNIKVNGIYLLDGRILEYLNRVEKQDFEDGLSLYAKENDARIVVLGKDYKSASLKYPWHIFNISNYLFDKNLTKKEIAKSAQIAKNAIIEGNVSVGENVKIYEGAVIKGPCYIGANSVIGNNSVIRDYCNLEEGALVGAFAEVARTIFQKDVHVHSGFFGDSIFNSGCRAGAGTVTANVRLDRGEVKVKTQKQSKDGKKIEEINTGLKSLGVISGENTKIGVHASLMPGILIGKDCMIGPATLTAENLDDGTVKKD